MSDTTGPGVDLQPLEGRRFNNLRRIAIEFVVIVVGVLVALALEASWGEYLERLEEKEAIAQLLADFRSNAARLDTTRAYHQMSLDASYELLRLTSGEGASSDTRTVAELASQMTSVWTYDPVLSGLNSLIHSGRLGILQNDSLRVALAGWPDIVEDLSENERQGWQNHFEQRVPFLMEAGVWVDIARARGRLHRLDPQPAPSASVLIRDPMLHQIVGDRAQNLHFVMEELETVDEAIETIIRLLEGS